MASRLKLFFRRWVPDAIVRPWRQLRGLSLDRRAREWAQREAFFDSVFKALKFNDISGDYAEFGCHGGKTFAFAYRAARRHRRPLRLWGFDSFRGLPPAAADADAHLRWEAGKLKTSVALFHRICRANRIPRDAYRVVEGFYEESLPRAEEPKDICLAYIDCDLYSSTKTVLEWLAPRLKHGMVLAFDDWFCWSATQPAGERKAAHEFFDGHETWHLLPYLQFGWHGMSFVVEDKSLV